MLCIYNCTPIQFVYIHIKGLRLMPAGWCESKHIWNSYDRKRVQGAARQIWRSHGINRLSNSVAGRP